MSKNDKKRKKSTIHKRKKNNKNKTIKIEMVISVVALFFSLCALLISFSQYKLYAKQDEEAKTAIWDGEYNSENNAFVFKSISGNIKPQTASIYFPSGLDLNTVIISPPLYSFSTIGLEYAIADYIDKTSERKNDFHQVIEGYIPIITDSNYITGGKLYNIISGYSISYTAVLSADELESPLVEINGLLFSHHITDKEKDLQSIIDNYWNNTHK